MRVLRYNQPGFSRQIARLDRRSEASDAVRQSVEDIIGQVRKGGDSALLALAEKFGGPRLRAAQLPVKDSEITEALESVSPGIRKVIREAGRNVADFAKKSLRRNWSSRNRQGALVGERFDPFDRVGIYVPGGTAPLVSTAVMTCTLARVAGVPEIVAVTPAGSDGKVNPALLAALRLSGATEVYRVGGAQAIAALAYGTKTIRPVRKIFGPGNSYVVEAKRQVFGVVGVDLLPGPSEIFIVADSTAPAAWLAADLLAQAEHGEGSVAILATSSSRVLSDVQTAIDQQLKKLSRSKELAASLRNAVLILTRDIGQAVEIANAFSPEHLTLAVKSPREWAGEIRTAGAIFLGALSPVAAGDFFAGPSHELPTGGAGKSFAGLTVDQFQRRTSLVEFDKRALTKSIGAIETFSRMEGLDAHGHSAAIRLRS